MVCHKLESESGIQVAKEVVSEASVRSRYGFRPVVAILPCPVSSRVMLFSVVQSCVACNTLSPGEMKDRREHLA